MLLRRIPFLLALALASAYAAPQAGAKLQTVYASMLGEFSDRSITNMERHARLKNHYAAAANTLGNTAIAPIESLRAVFSMSEAMLIAELGYSQPLPQPYVADMFAVFKELSRRGAASAEQRNAMIGAHLSIWQIEEAKALTTPETRIKGSDIAALKRVGAFESSTPAVVSLTSADGIARAKPYEFRKGTTIVVSAGCHIARRAAEAIYADPAVSSAFREADALWLSPATVTFDPIALNEWNTRFPNAQMHVAFDNSRWEGIDFARLPSFHFYVDGRLVKLIRGWGDDSAMLEEIRTVLESLGMNAPPESSSPTTEPATASGASSG